MYKNTSRTAQRRRDSGRLEGTRPQTPQEKAQHYWRQMESRASIDLARLHDPAHLARIGGWPLDRLDAIGATFRVACLSCNSVAPEKHVIAEKLVRLFGGFSAGTQLFRVRRLLRCDRCGSRRVAIDIKTRRGNVRF